MIGEMNVGGVFVPVWLIVALIGFALTVPMKAIFRRLNLYRFVWHAGLFDVAMFVVLTWCVAMATGGAPFNPSGASL